MGTRAEDRVWAKVEKRGPDECWPWQAGIFRRTGYGQVRWKGRPQAAHRVVLMLTLGRPLAPRMDACHTCPTFNPLCCNPAHLYEGTRKQNVADARAQGRLSTGAAHAATMKNRARGERQGSAKLTEEQVRSVRVLADSGWSFRSLGREFGVSHHVISGIVHRTRWTHVEGGQ